MKHSNINLAVLNDYRLKRLKIKCLKKWNNLDKSFPIMQHILTKDQKNIIVDKIYNYVRLSYNISREIGSRKVKKITKKFITSSLPPTTNPTRLEVIDIHGRRYVNMNCSFELSYQDNGNTLKIFVK
jgi:hypothetical protein